MLLKRFENILTRIVTIMIVLRTRVLGGRTHCMRVGKLTIIDDKWWNRPRNTYYVVIILQRNIIIILFNLITVIGNVAAWKQFERKTERWNVDVTIGAHTLLGTFLRGDVETLAPHSTTSNDPPAEPSSRRIPFIFIDTRGPPFCVFFFFFF